MKSKALSSFWKRYNKLPDDVKDLADKAYRLFKLNPQYPGLQFKCVDTEENIYSARIGLYYRALGILQDDEIVWFWIGTHAEYDKQIGGD